MIARALGGKMLARILVLVALGFGLKGALIEFRPLTWSLSKPAATPGVGEVPLRVTSGPTRPAPTEDSGPILSAFRSTSKGRRPVRKPASFHAHAEPCF